MNSIWQSKQLEEALGVSVPADLKTGKLEFNSRDVAEGDLFIALPGGKRDAHDFVADALKRGAAAVIVSKPVDGVEDSKLILVDDTMAALGQLADYKRTNSKATFIGITGTVGKTSTKEAMHLITSKFGKSFVSRGNFNNHMGVPLNLASMPDDIDYAIIEMGMSARGEISALTKQVLPDVAVITHVAEGHLEAFPSVQAIADAKCEIFQGLDLVSGKAVLAKDIATHSRCMENIDKLNIQNVRTFGKSTDADIRFEAYEIIEDNNVRLTFDVMGETISFIMPYIPEHIASNFAACLAVCNELDLDLETCIEALQNYQLVLGRGRIVSCEKAGKKFEVVTDYYNSNPESLAAALRNFAVLDGTNKTLVLGDMGGLRDEAERLHKKMTPLINESGAKKLMLIGEYAPLMKEGITEEIEVKSFVTLDDFLAQADELFTGGELVLIKASRFMKLDKVANYLGIENAL